MQDIILKSEFRDKGYGSRILNWIEKYLKTIGIKQIYLESGIKNTDAHKFFNRNGYKTIAVNMMKEIE